MVYCADYRRSYSILMSAARWSDDVRLSDIEPLFVCHACGRRGADVRPWCFDDAAPPSRRVAPRTPHRGWQVVRDFVASAALAQ